MRVAVGQHPGNDKDYLDFGLQLGCVGASFQTPAIKGEVRWEEADVRAFLAPVHAAGVRVESFENVPHHFYDKLMLGLSGRDEQLENMKVTIRALGASGVPILGMNWMPQSVWRTDMGHYGRGGAYVSVYDHSVILDGSRDSEIWVARRDQRDTTLKDTFTRGSFVPLGVESISAEQMWANYEYFVKGVIRTCEESRVVLCFHPDDPPPKELHGIARILNTVDNLERAVTIVDSPNLKLELCLGSVSEMDGANSVMDAVNRFASADKIAYVHLRDVSGTFPFFQECFLGEGNYSPFEVIKALHKHGFTGSILDDHTPSLTGDSAYGHRGRAHAIGYIQALIEVVTSN
jgi:mannonate dehydratase